LTDLSLYTIYIQFRDQLDYLFDFELIIKPNLAQGLRLRYEKILHLRPGKINKQLRLQISIGILK